MSVDFFMGPWEHSSTVVMATQVWNILKPNEL
jgi:hypothetical protein